MGLQGNELLLSARVERQLSHHDIRIYETHGQIREKPEFASHGRLWTEWDGVHAELPDCSSEVCP